MKIPPNLLLLRINCYETSICILLFDCRVASFAPYTPIATNILFFNNEIAENAPEGFATKETWFYRLDMPEGYKHFSKTKPMKSEHCNPIKEWWNDRKEIVVEDGNEKSRCYSVEELIATDCNFDLCKFPKDDEEIFASCRATCRLFQKTGYA